MNNPGIDLTVWEQLRKKWAELQSADHELEIEFRLIIDPEDKDNVLAIDVIQTIDNDVFTETVQRNAGEAYTALGIAGLSMERLVEVYKEMMKKLFRQAKTRERKLIITMSTSSHISGVVKGHIEDSNSKIMNGFQVNYRHYYVLNAIRDKMVELVGDSWHTVRAVYCSGGLEFYFEY